MKKEEKSYNYTIAWKQSYPEWKDSHENFCLNGEEFAEANAVIDYIKSL